MGDVDRRRFVMRGAYLTVRTRRQLSGDVVCRGMTVAMKMFVGAETEWCIAEAPWPSPEGKGEMEGDGEWHRTCI